MSETLKELKGVARSAKSLHAEVKKLRNAGEDKKTDKIEARALKFIAKLEVAAINAAQPGEGASDDLIEVLKVEEGVLKARLKQDLPFAESLQVETNLMEVQFKLGAIQIGAALQWDSLLSQDELEEFKEELKASAQAVRRRTKLQSVIDSVFGVGIMAVKLTSKIARLAI